MPKNIRQPAVAGQFYPGDASRLELKIKQFLEAATSSDDLLPHPDPLLETRRGGVKAIIVPHAGYDYSGPVAAYAYKKLSGKKVKTAVLIGNSHTTYFSGAAIDDSDSWQTPLGEIEVDKELRGKLVKADEFITTNGQPHEDEHSLEVQVPFLQTVLDSEFKIVPILFGNAGEDGYKKLAKALADNLGENDIVVISTDMSHYPSYANANKIDNETLNLIKAGSIQELVKYIDEMENAGVPNEQTLLCGIDAVNTVMEIANIKDWGREILKYANSGDSEIGTKDQVVGYGAVAFIQKSDADDSGSGSSRRLAVSESSQDENLNNEQKTILMNIATSTIESYVRNGKTPEFTIADERLNVKQGAFVTLKKDGHLRGCIGQIIPGSDPLWQVIRDMAIAAATEDPRFSPVTKDELDKLEYEISVLSVPQAIDDWRKIEMGKHGVIIKSGWHSGVFLPQVATETGWSREEFLSQLCYQKAGLPVDCYKDKNLKLEVFTALVF